MKSMVIVLLMASLAMAGECERYTFQDLEKWDTYTISFDENSGIRIAFNPDFCTSIKTVRMYVDHQSEIPTKIPFYWYTVDDHTFIYHWDKKSKGYIPLFNSP